MANFQGGADDDIFTGGSEADVATGAGGDDLLSGGALSDNLAGGAGEDVLDGGAGDDVLYGGERSGPFTFPFYDSEFTPPTLDTGSDRDVLRGGTGDDRIFAGYGDVVDGGDQEPFTDGYTGDYLYVSFMGATEGVIADFSQETVRVGGGSITGFENISWIQGSDFDDQLLANNGFGGGYSEFGVIEGMGGNDLLVANYYTGGLYGGTGDDVVDGRNSQYLNGVYGDSGDDILYTNSNTFAEADGGDGADLIYAHSAIRGGDGDDRIIVQPSYYGGLVRGDAGDDVISVSPDAFASYFLSGGDGADRVTGSASNDALASGGIDALSGALLDDMGLEADVVLGGDGDDLISAGYGDSIDGEGGQDQLRLSFGGLGVGIEFDTSGINGARPLNLGGGVIQNVEVLAYLRGSEFGDRLTIATQGDLMEVDAGAGDDTILTNLSSVRAFGGLGDDRFVSGRAGDRFDGGEGADTIDYRLYATAVTVDLAQGSGAGGDELTSIENAIGSELGDALSGDDGANALYGRGGDDTLNGRGGADIMAGGLDDDTYTVDDAGDRVVEAADQGDDLVVSSVSFGLGGTYVERLTLTGVDAVNATGNSLRNTLTGNAAANRLDGGGGDDLLIGGLGDDTYVIDTAGDRVIEMAGEGFDTIVSAIDFSLAGLQIEALTLSGSGDIDAIGNSFDNVLTGNRGNNELRGGKGDDTYYVQNRGDRVVEIAGYGEDTVVSTVSFSLAGQYVETLRLDGSADLYGIGNSLDNVMIGNAGANRLRGGAGDDTYYVQTAGDIALETRGLGHDTVISSVSYSLAGQYVEDLVLTGSDALSAIGNSLANVITGNAGDNRIDGGGGADRLEGGMGADRLDGGSGGGDVYVYRAQSDSTVARSDTIVELGRGDRLDLSLIDASSAASGDQAFMLVDAFSGVRGQATLSYDATAKMSTLLLDLDGDRTADMRILIGGDADEARIIW